MKYLLQHMLILNVKNQMLFIEFFFILLSSLVIYVTKYLQKCSQETKLLRNIKNYTTRIVLSNLSFVQVLYTKMPISSLVALNDESIFLTGFWIKPFFLELFVNTEN